jgi:hypothetical protein
VVGAAVELGAVDALVLGGAPVVVVGAGPTALAASTMPTPNDASRPAGPRSRAVPRSRSTAACGERPWARSRASTPATCGAAIEVPARQAYSLAWSRIQ